MIAAVPALRRNRELLYGRVPLLRHVLQALHGVGELAHPGQVAGEHRARAALAREAVHGREVLVVRLEPALDGRADLEDQPERRRRVAREVELEHLVVEVRVVVRLLAEVPDHVVAAVPAVEVHGHQVDRVVLEQRAVRAQVHVGEAHGHQVRSSA
ncbi:hypothetical protein ON010_g7569 [Phytophthora cinnamomi]|nr:hypothetical protein ON010_g7569 [Phytophthora cinnamomi]